MQNSQKSAIPIRYVYYQGKIIDFKNGIDSIFDIVPSISAGSNGQLQISNFGAGIYLSPKVANSLFAKLYFLNDVFNKYPSIKVAYEAPDPNIQMLNSEGANLGRFVYIPSYGQLASPLDIWKVDYPNYIIPHKEFLSVDGQYAAFDNLTFTK